MPSRFSEGYREFRLWTLLELLDGARIWELLGDTRNYFPDAEIEENVQQTQRLVRDLYESGLVSLARYTDDDDFGGPELTEAEVEDFLAHENWTVDGIRDLPAYVKPTKEHEEWRRRMRGGATPVRVDHVVIAVSTWTRSNWFYGEVLGAELIELDKGRYAYRFGEQQLNVHGPGSTPQPRAADPVRPGNSDLCFVWDGTIEQAVQRLRDFGIEPELGPVPRLGARGAGTSVYFRDPDGSLLELISYS